MYYWKHGDKTMTVKVLMIARFNNKAAANGIANHNGLTHAASATYDCLRDIKELDIAYALVQQPEEIENAISEHKPKFVFMDGLWIKPERIRALQKAHMYTIFILRIHSDAAFIAQEGIFSNWFYKYIEIPNVYVAFNGIDLYNVIVGCYKAGSHKVLYLPNMYPIDISIKKPIKKDKNIIRISSFGAARVLKNHFAQALAALKFAELLNKKLILYININTADVSGLAIYLNILHLIKLHPSNKHEVKLVEWTEHKQFLEAIKEVDIGMQASLSETFNLVSCDTLSTGTPIVGTKEIPWISWIGRCNPTSHRSMLAALWRAYTFQRINVYLNKRSLERFSNKSVKIWKKVLLGDLAQ